MKRFLCPQHSHHLVRIRKDHKPIQLSTEKCSICRWEKRPWTLKDVAVELRHLAESLEMCHSDPYYDPFGVSFMGHFEEIVRGFLKSIHPGYRDNFLKGLTKDDVSK